MLGDAVGSDVRVGSGVVGETVGLCEGNTVGAGVSEGSGVGRRDNVGCVVIEGLGEGR
jgi:hypothetical protein